MQWVSDKMGLKLNGSQTKWVSNKMGLKQNGSQTKWVSNRVGQSVESALSALSAIFWALSAYFDNFWQSFLKCRDKRKSYLIVLQQNNTDVP